MQENAQPIIKEEFSSSMNQTFIPTMEREFEERMRLSGGQRQGFIDETARFASSGMTQTQYGTTTTQYGSSYTQQPILTGTTSNIIGTTMPATTGMVGTTGVIDQT